jgi:hypothetical protein
MSAVSHSHPFTIIREYLRGECEQEAKRLLHEGYAEVTVARKEDLRPMEFFRVKTHAGPGPEERWTLTKRAP